MVIEFWSCARTVGLLAIANGLTLGGADRLAVIRRAPDFTLTTQKGESFRFADHKGKVVLVSFIFTTCSGSCPATTHRMAHIQQQLQARQLLKDGKVQLVSISLDPTRDTPEVLRKYMNVYDVDAASWRFLTGEREHVDNVIKSWGMWARPGANGQLDHPSRIFLIDKLGKIREIYNLDFLKTAWVVEDIQMLLDEKP